MNIVVSFQDGFQDQTACERLAWAARTAVAQALARFANRIRGITVRFAGLHDDAAGTAPRCALAIDVASGREIVLEASGPPEGVLRGLAQRAAHSVRAAITRRRPNH